jgi:aspartyl-tRNA(Asn)/glutamyl-tRNA(Gln) amidotransferase subunit A
MNSATATSLLAQLNRGAITSEDIVRSLLDRTERLKRLNVFVHLDPEAILGQARAIDERRKAGLPVGPLAGVPVAIKDVICVEGEPTTCGSRMLGALKPEDSKKFRPPYDATVITRLRQAGAILFGKTNMDEFAMGSSTENSAYGPTKNPWDETRVPGGSSGGSAAAVAALLAPVSLGSDTGGSIRQPAAVCGIVGLKPTYGRVSRYGLIAYASSLDQIGHFAHDLADTALLLKVISGHDPRDSTSVNQPVPDYPASLDTPPQSLRMGVVREFFGEGLDPEVEAAVREAIRVYQQAGATIKEVSLPNTRAGIPAYYIVAPAECSSNLARYDGTIYGHRAEEFSPKYPGEENLAPLVRMMMVSRSEGFGAEVKRRIMLGTFALSAGYADQYYNQALKVRRLIRNDFDSAFKDVDVLIGPTSPTAAFKLGERTGDPLAMYLSDIYTITANLAGIPGLSIPCGLTKSNLPIGLQLLAPAFAEERLLRTARVFERATDWHLKRPTINREPRRLNGPRDEG